MAVTRLGKGAGNRVTSGSSVSWTSFNITSSDANTVTIVSVNMSMSTNVADTCSVTYGGVSMTQLNLTNLGSTSTTRAAVGMYYLFNPGTGAKTVTATTTGGTNTALAGIDVAFSGVDSAGVGTAQTAAATTHAVTSVTNGYSLRVLSNGAALTSPNQTSEYLAGSSVTGVGDYISVQSAAGTGSSISFTCTGTATTPQSIGVALSPVIPPGPAISTLIDDFNTGSTPNAAKWTAVAGSPVLTSGNLVIPSGAELDSLITYNPTGDSVFVQAKTVSADGYFVVSGAAVYGWIFNSSTQAEAYFVGAGTGVTRTHTSGDWYRVRESGGTIYLDYSTDGTSWTNLYSGANSYNLTNSLVVFTSLNVGSNTFDNLNVAPATGNTTDFFRFF